MAEIIDPVHDEYILEIPEQKTLDVSPKRQPQRAGGPWPAGTRIVSADTHIIEHDNWIDRFPGAQEGPGAAHGLQGRRLAIWTTDDKQ